MCTNDPKEHTILNHINEFQKWQEAAGSVKMGEFMLRHQQHLRASEGGPGSFHRGDVVPKKLLFSLSNQRNMTQLTKTQTLQLKSKEKSKTVVVKGDHNRKGKKKIYRNEQIRQEYISQLQMKKNELVGKGYW